MVAESTMTSRPPSASAPGLGLYLALLAVQTAGAAIVLVNGVPIYRQLASDFASHRSQPEIKWWAFAAVLLIQAGYWLRVRLQPALPAGGHVLIGHVAAFVARLSFILASSFFGVVFLIRFEELSLPPQRIAMILALLFSMFCWTLELERLAKALHGAGEKN